MEPKPQFLHKGFRHVSEFRVFLFERVAPDRSRTAVSVKADVALSRRYGISLQELPLLCRAFLEDSTNGTTQTPLIYGETEMRLHAETVAARRAAARPPRRPFRKQADGDERSAEEV